MTPWILGALALAGCDAGKAPTRRPPIALTDCRLDGLAAPAACGTLEVLEDRSAAQGRRISLRVAIAPALFKPAAPDPLFLLVGGPGQAATEVGPAVAQSLSALRRTRDVVFVDQRGAGSSNPLDCALYDEDDLAGPLEDPVSLAALARCVRGWDADLAHYGTAAAADDLEEVRVALGYGDIDLWGASYGTRLALEYARRHGEHLRAMVLDGAAPAGMVLPLAAAADGQAALDAFSVDVAQDFPTFRQDLDRLLAHPPGSVVVAHPRTGERQRLHVDRDALASLVRGALYLPELASLLPVAVRQALQGDLVPFVGLAGALSAGMSDGVSVGLMLAVLCAEDVPRIGPGDVARSVRGTIFGPALVTPVVDACAVIPAPPAPPERDAPVRSDVPTLILSGAADPATPPRWGRRVASGLSRVRHLEVAGMGHGLTRRGCLPDVVADFVEGADVEALDVACVARLRRPAPFVGVTGPKP